MVITHNFNSNADYAKGGEWLDDYGRSICHWEWHAASKEFVVTSDNGGSTIDLSQFGDHQLKERLPKLAIETARRLNNKRYDF